MRDSIIRPSLEAEHDEAVVRDADAPLSRTVALPRIQPEACWVGAAGYFASCKQSRIRRSRGTRPAGGRTVSSRSFGARGPLLCLIFMIHCSAPNCSGPAPTVRHDRRQLCGTVTCAAPGHALREHVRRPLLSGGNARARTAADGESRVNDAAGERDFSH